MIPVITVNERGMSVHLVEGQCNQCDLKATHTLHNGDTIERYCEFCFKEAVASYVLSNKDVRFRQIGRYEWEM